MESLAPVVAAITSGKFNDQGFLKLGPKQPTQERYDYAVFIGRFQPFHNGHKAVIDKALSIADRVIVLVGSANVPRTTRNPFTYTERRDFIEGTYPQETAKGQLLLAPLNDYTYDNDAWIEAVQGIVRSIVRGTSKLGWSDKSIWDDTHLGENKVTLIGRNKDNSSFYLKLFPNWSNEDAFDESVSLLNATDIRNRMFSQGGLWNEENVPMEVFNKLSKFRQTEVFQTIREEQYFCDNYKKQFSSLPYPPTFNTVDAVIRCSGHTLLVTRKAKPGKGLLALPGGFVEQDETLLEACVREVFEETKIKLTREILLLSLRGCHTFDDPYRDPRGRFITTAFLFDIGNCAELPQVKGGSDASRADWVPNASLTAEKLYADHFFIIRKFS